MRFGQHPNDLPILTRGEVWARISLGILIGFSLAVATRKDRTRLDGLGASEALLFLASLREKSRNAYEKARSTTVGNPASLQKLKAEYDQANADYIALARATVSEGHEFPEQEKHLLLPDPEAPKKEKKLRVKKEKPPKKVKRESVAYSSTIKKGDVGHRGRAEEKLALFKQRLDTERALPWMIPSDIAPGEQDYFSKKLRPAIATEHATERGSLVEKWMKTGRLWVALDAEDNEGWYARSADGTKTKFLGPTHGPKATADIEKYLRGRPDPGAW